MCIGIGIGIVLVAPNVAFLAFANFSRSSKDRSRHTIRFGMWKWLKFSAHVQLNERNYAKNVSFVCAAIAKNSMDGSGVLVRVCVQNVWRTDCMFSYESMISMRKLSTFIDTHASSAQRKPIVTIITVGWVHRLFIDKRFGISCIFSRPRLKYDFIPYFSSVFGLAGEIHFIRRLIELLFHSGRRMSNQWGYIFFVRFSWLRERFACEWANLTIYFFSYLVHYNREARKKRWNEIRSILLSETVSSSRTEVMPS